ncbi:Pol [Symbiodinium sp. CCMP2456]|nr:Pol [Symbiodinium sp. CCMP2456]
MDPTAAEDAAIDATENTPHDHGRGPLRAADLLPKGPPPPMPVGGATMASSHSARASDDPQPAQDTDDDSDDEPERRWPTVLETDESGRQCHVRVAGPHLPNGRFAETTSESAEDSGSGSDDGGSSSRNSSTWSDNSVCLVGPALQEALGHFLGLYRMELAATVPGITSRSQGARVGALRRRLSSQDWWRLQRAAHASLSGERLQQWADWEYAHTHPRRPRRAHRARDPADDDKPPHRNLSQVQSGSFTPTAAAAGGVRIPPGFAAGGEPVATAAGKHRDLVPPQAPATQSTAKRAVRRTTLDRNTGLLFLLKRKAFQDPRFLDINPGRRTRPAQTPAYNAQALCSAARSGAPLAQELQHRVGLRLQDVDTSVLSTAHQHVNRILQEETCALFPAQPAPDHRISAQPAFRVTARAVWGLYHAFKRSGVCTFRNIFAKWRLATQFARASKALRQSSQQLKKQFFQGQVEDAELAASRGDQRGRLRDDSGRLLTRDEELEAIVQYGNDVIIPAADLAAELSKLGPAKAVPKHIVLSHALTLHLRQGTSAPLDTDWKVTELVSRTRATRFQQQAGQKTRGCAGGVSLSLDLSKAFDGVTRSHIYQEMRKQGVDSSVITIVQQLHHRARYIYRVGDSQGSTLTTNGIKQGCVIAPYLWNFFSLAFLLLLRDQRDLSWIQRVLSLFADDAWGAWVIASAADFQQALSDITLILETLESLHMIVNFDKTAILLHLVGKESKKLRRNHTFMKAGQLHLRLWVHGREQAIPIRDQHVYLGTIVTYHSRLERNMEHRIKAARANYQGLRKLLNGAHALDTDHRIRLWKACVCSSVMYSQHVVGVTAKTLKRLTTVLTRHLRAILRVPAHLTHVTNQAVWHQASLPMPGWTIQCALLQHQTKLQQTAASGTDITSTPQALAHVDILAGRLEALLLEAAQTLATEAVSAPSISMPACRLCQRQFFRWTHLKLHIETGACAALGGDSMIRAPPLEAHAPAPIKPPPTAGLAVFAEENVMHLPLIKRQAFLASLGNWEKWLSVPELRQELKNYCSICHMMYGDPLTMDAFAHEEAEIFANLWTGPEPYLEDGRSQKRQRPEQHRWSMPPAQRPNQPHHRGGPPPPRPMHPLQNHINLLGRVVLQQEDIISRLRNDKNFVLFLRNDANGTLGTLMRISRDWKAKKSLEPEQLKSPLRTVLIACMIRELMNLAQQAVATEEARNKHVTLEWLNSEGNWNYRRWNPAERRLEVDKTRSPLQHAEAIRLLNFLLKCMTGDIVQRFAASKTLNFLEQQGAQVATFHLEISLRGSRAQEVYDALDRFTGSTLMNLIGVSMKRDTMPRSPLAKKLAEQVYPSHQGPRPLQR